MNDSDDDPFTNFQRLKYQETGRRFEAWMGIPGVWYIIPVVRVTDTEAEAQRKLQSIEKVLVE